MFFTSSHFGSSGRGAVALMRCASILHGRKKGNLTLTDTKAEWRNSSDELKQSIDYASVKKAIWLLGQKLTLKLLTGEKVVKFGGFQESQREQVANVLKAANAEIAFTTEEVDWAKCKKYKKFVTSYIYFRPVLASIDADLCK